MNYMYTLTVKTSGYRISRSLFLAKLTEHLWQALYGIAISLKSITPCIVFRLNTNQTKRHTITCKKNNRLKPDIITYFLITVPISPGQSRFLINTKKVSRNPDLEWTRSLKAKSTYSVILTYAVTSLFEILPPIPEVTSLIGKILSESCSAGPN